MDVNRKGTLMRIGERLFAQHGYRDVSIKDITSSAGLGMGSFYTYFPSKEAFYSEILDAIEQKGIHDVEKHVNSLRSPLFRLKALFRYTTLSLRSNEILRGIYTGEKRYLYPGLEERAQRGNGLLAAHRDARRRDPRRGHAARRLPDQPLPQPHGHAPRHLHVASPQRARPVHGGSHGRRDDAHRARPQALAAFPPAGRAPGRTGPPARLTAGTSPQRR